MSGRKQYRAERPVLVGTGGLPLEGVFEMVADELARSVFG